MGKRLFSMAVMDIDFRQKKIACCRRSPLPVGKKHNAPLMGCFLFPIVHEFGKDCTGSLFLPMGQKRVSFAPLSLDS
jgi:hypothetical protein